MGATLEYTKADATYTFHDRYNPTGLLIQLGLSWWTDVAPLRNRNDELSPRKVKQFRAMIEAHQVGTPQQVCLRLRQWGADGTVRRCGWKTAKQAQAWFAQRRAELLDYLTTATEHQATIFASL